MPSLTKTSTAGTGISYFGLSRYQFQKGDQPEPEHAHPPDKVGGSTLRVGSSLCTRQDRVVFSAVGQMVVKMVVKVAQYAGLRRAFLTLSSMKTPAVLSENSGG